MGRVEGRSKREEDEPDCLGRVVGLGEGGCCAICRRDGSLVQVSGFRRVDLSGDGNSGWAVGHGLRGEVEKVFCNYGLDVCWDTVLICRLCVVADACCDGGDAKWSVLETG